VAGGRQICQFTVVVVEPDPTALNCCVPRSTTVAVVGLIVTPTFVELPPHPTMQAASNAATLNLPNFITLPPSIASPLRLRFPKSSASQTLPDRHQFRMSGL
jgi:hypothetical protein